VANTNLASDRAGCVFDDWDLVAPSDLDDGGHVARQADLMHAEYRPRLGRYRGLYKFRSDIESLRIDIDEYRLGAAVHDGVCGRDIGMTDRDDFVTWPDADSKQRQVQGRRAIRDGARVRRAD